MVVCVAGTVPGAAKFICGEETAVVSIFKRRSGNVEHVLGGLRMRKRPFFLRSEFLRSYF